MQKDDLTKLKHVGPSRMRLLNKFGITTIKQLHEIPLATLAEIKAINIHYARLIKNSVAEYYQEKDVTLPGEIGSADGKKTKPLHIHTEYQKRIRKLRKNLNRVNEDLKPLWEKKYLILYVDFKKKTTKLKTRLKALARIKDSLSDKDKEKIIKNASALTLKLKKIEKRPKKKKYREITLKIQSFSRMLSKIMS